MTTTTEKALPAREILLLGPYGVLGTGVLDAAAAIPPGALPQQLGGPRLHIVPRLRSATSMSTYLIAKTR
jgi:hypothetical protein